VHYCDCKGTTKLQLLQRVFQRMLTFIFIVEREYLRRQSTVRLSEKKTKFLHSFLIFSGVQASKLVVFEFLPTASSKVIERKYLARSERYEFTISPNIEPFFSFICAMLCCGEERASAIPKTSKSRECTFLHIPGSRHFSAQTLYFTQM